jgi:hypothetical protein
MTLTPLLLTHHADNHDAQSADQQEHAGKNNDETYYVLSSVVDTAPPLDRLAVLCW